MTFEILKSKSIHMAMRIFFFLSISGFGLAQSEADSLESIWSDQKVSAKKRFAAYESYFLLLISADPKAIANSSYSHFKLAKKEESKKEMLLALGNQAQAFSMSGQDDTAIDILERAYKIAKKYNDSVSMATNQVNRGVIYTNRADFKNAVRNYTKSLALFEAKKMEDKQAVVYSNLGLIFFEINDFKLSLDYFEKALSLLKKLGVAEKSEYIWTYLGGVYFEMGKNKKALEYTQKSLNILKTKNNKVSLAECHYSLSRIYDRKGEIKKAIQSIKLSLKYGLEIGNHLSMTRYKVMFGNLLLDQDVEKATVLGKEALNLFTSNTTNAAKVDVYHLLYRCYKRQDKVQLSFDMLEKHRIYMDSALIEKSNIDITREAIQSEFAKKLYENKIKNEKVQATLKIKQLQRVFLIIIVAVVLFFLLFFYYRSKLVSNRKQRDELLQEIEVLKTNANQSVISQTTEGFKLVREKIEKTIGRKLNDTDWNVLNILVDDPVIANKEIAEKAFMSLDGIGSSLRRMYDFFEIKESKYKKISLLLEAIKISNRNIIN